MLQSVEWAPVFAPSTATTNSKMEEEEPGLGMMGRPSKNSTGGYPPTTPGLHPPSSKFNNVPYIPVATDYSIRRKGENKIFIGEVPTRLHLELCPLLHVGQHVHKHHVTLAGSFSLSTGFWLQYL